jgi:hypothetical protein
MLGLISSSRGSIEANAWPRAATATHAKERVPASPSTDMAGT